MKKTLVILALAAFAPAMWAQTKSQPQRTGGQVSERFRQFRDKVMDNYNDYRSRVLENYDKFLEGTWTELAGFKGEEFPMEPKPKVVPEAPKDLSLTPPSVIPTPTVVKPQPIVAPEPEHDKVHDVRLPGPNFPTVSPGTGTVPTVSPIESPEPEHDLVPEASLPGLNFPLVDPNTGAVPTVSPIARPELPADNETRPGGTIRQYPGGAAFDFYGMQLSLPAPKVDLIADMNSNMDYANQWRTLAGNGFREKVVDPIAEFKQETGLGDYFLIELVQNYLKAAYPRVSASSRASVAHFILANLGYDVRIGRNNEGAALLLIPLVQDRMYARMFLPIDGKNYYVFPDDAHSQNDLGLYWNVCQLPKEAAKGQRFNLRLSGMNLPMKPYDFDVECGPLRLKGTVNENLMKMVYRYPQMEMGEYAASSLMPELREDLVRQVREQLDGMEQLDAINTLLRFIQSGFQYATDDDLHGFEKPYFLEECFYQPKCDCEDRAIMYSYLLWNALGVENHLINYPGHEATAVRLQKEWYGDNYDYEGKKFYISDPTYRGAGTGNCMKEYKTTRPVIDYIYSD